MNKLKKQHLLKNGKNNLSIKSIVVKHGYINSIAYIINNVCAYAPDISNINLKDLKHFKNLNYFIVDCLRYTSHPAHFNLDDVLNLIKIIKPKKTILTNLNNEIDYSEIKKKVPNNVVPAYDGLSLLV